MQITLTLLVAYSQEPNLPLPKKKPEIGNIRYTTFQEEDRKYMATELPHKHVKMRRNKLQTDNYWPYGEKIPGLEVQTSMLGGVLLCHSMRIVG